MKAQLAILFLATASSAAFSQELVLGCHGSTFRDEGDGVRRTLPVALEVRVDPIAGVMRITGLSCWAGKGDCSKLAVRVTDGAIRAAGDGQLAKTGMSTTIEIDRRSGYMRFNQGRDIGSQLAPQTGPQSEDAQLICQGGTQPRF